VPDVSRRGALASEPRQRQLMLDVERVASLHEPRLNRGNDIPWPAALHRTTISR